MLVFIKFFIVLSFLISSAQAKTYYYESLFDDFFTDQLIEEVQVVNSHLLLKFPPNKYTYIFVGRSLSLNRLILEVEGYPSVELPFSGANLHEIRLKVSAEYLRDRLNRHLHNHLPRYDEINRLGIVLIDYTSSGASLRRAELEVKAFYGSTIAVKTYSVSSHRLLFNGFNSGFRVSKEGRLYKNLELSNFDSLAEFPKYLINTEDPNPISNYDPEVRIAAKKWLEKRFNPHNECLEYFNR